MATAAASPATVVQTTNPDALLVRAIGVRQLAATIFNTPWPAASLRCRRPPPNNSDRRRRGVKVVCTVIMMLVLRHRRTGSRVHRPADLRLHRSRIRYVRWPLSGVFLVVQRSQRCRGLDALQAQRWPVNFRRQHAQAAIVIAVTLAAVISTLAVCGGVLGSSSS